MAKQRSHNTWCCSMGKKNRLRNRFPILLVLPCVFGFFVICILLISISDKFGQVDSDESIHLDESFLRFHDNIPGVTPNPKLSLLRVVRPSDPDFQPKSNFSLTGTKLHTNPIQPDWQTVAGSSDKFFVYSAYYIEMPTHIVRVIGAAKTKSRQRVQCRLYDSTGVHFNTTNATVRTIRENWNLKYSACFIICHLSPLDGLPEYISVTASASKSSLASNILRVQYNRRHSRYSSGGQTSDTKIVEFSACVKPIHFNYDKRLQFLEWMEFHRLMGVRHFTFYNDTIGDSVACLLRNVYKDIVTVLPWKLPMISQKEIRTEGLFAALNDCIYRHRGKSRHVILVDFDEMIVPNRAGNYYQLLKDVRAVSKKKNIAAYSFQNGFFYLQWPNDASNLTNYNLTNYPLAQSISHQLLTLQKLRRKSRLHPHKQRSKYICDPEKVVEAGNHFIWEMLPGYSTVLVPPHLAFLHHYRLCEFGGNQCTKDPSIVDKSMVAFGRKLAIKVAQQVEKMSQDCFTQIQ